MRFLRQITARSSTLPPRGRSAIPTPIIRMVPLVFGREDAGLPEELLAANQQQCVRMPMRKGERCLNLSNAVAVGVYEVLRQWDFADLETHGQLTRFEWK